MILERYQVLEEIWKFTSKQNLNFIIIIVVVVVVVAP